MLEEGKVNAEEAARLLDALGESSGEPPAQSGRKIHVRITDPNTRKKKVNLTLPIGLARIAAKFIPRDAKREMAEEGVDIDAVLNDVLSENLGKLVDIETDEGYVEIWVD
jgi:hypothetical protein